MDRGWLKRKGAKKMSIYKKIKKNIEDEIKVSTDRDPAIKSRAEILLYPSLHALLHYRLAHYFYRRRLFFLARLISVWSARRTGIEIHPGVRTGKGLFIDHGHGVVIGETAVIGNNVTIYQGVTLGGTGKEWKKRHPTIEDNVMISAGAKILGSFTVGHDSKIGAGAVVLHPVPPYSTVVGIPGRVVKNRVHQAPKDTLNQVDLPDPIRREICKLKLRMRYVEHRAGGLSKEDLDYLYQECCEGDHKCL